MCGIAGLVDLNRDKIVSRELLSKMSDVIVHRGPDSDGYFINSDNTCGLTFRRLAIIDLSNNGSQPMTSPDGRYTIVFNGEIYNHSELRTEFVGEGKIYRSNTDTETILYGFQKYGLGILDKLLGMWAIAIWDDFEKKLFIARDRIGIKPLYWYYNDGIFIFGSEIKSILQAPKINRNVNLSELANYLNFGMSSKKSSLFSRINKLESGSYGILNQKGDFETRKWWNVMDSSHQYQDLSFDEAKEELLKLLKRAIKDRMMSDVPFGVFLSGGIDSSANVALMAELMDRPVDTFTVGFKELEKFNELKYARQISELYNTNHREVLIDDKDAFEVLEDIAFHTDEPNADPVCIPLYFLSELTRKEGVVVIQVGEGSDEQFVGYPWMLREYNFYEKYWEKYQNIPSLIRKSIYGVARPFLKASDKLLELEYLRRMSYGEASNWSGISIFSPMHLQEMLGTSAKNFAFEPSKYGNSLHKEAMENNPNADYLQKILYVELKQRLAEILLMRVDKITMAHSLEARVPFLDHRIVEFSMSLKPNLKVPDRNATKVLLKSALESILPADIIHRKKQGFAAPIDNWMRNSWFDYAQSEINNSFFVKEGIIRKDYVNRLFNKHKSESSRLGASLYSLLALALWHKKHF